MTDKFWIGGTATWNNANDLNWSLTSGGPNNTTHPVAGDRVFIDGNSGVGTISRAAANVVCDSLDCNGYTGTLSLGTVTTTLAVGDLRFSAGMTLTVSTGAMIFTGTTTQNVTSAGKTLPPFTINGTGTVKYLDTSSHGASAVILTKGTYDLNGFTITMGSFTSSNANVRALNMNGGTISSLGATNGFSWTTSTITNFTIQAGGRIIMFASASPSNLITSVAGITIPGIELYGVQGVQGPTCSFDTAAPLASLYVRGAQAGGTLTLIQNLTVTGSCQLIHAGYGLGNLSVVSNDTVTPLIRTLTLNGYVRAEGITFAAITAAGNQLRAAGNSVDNGNNSGIVFTGAGDGVDYGIIGHLIL